MAITQTTYLELNKPDYDAIADIDVLNGNADIIDAMFDGTHLVESVNGETPVGGAVTIDLGVTSVNGQTGAVTITERSVKQLIDIIYPVGSFYETTDTSFNPNTAWTGTTWVKITDGRVLIAGGGDYNVGTNYGEKTHKITTSEMPQHNHTATTGNAGAHSHGGSTSTNGAHTHAPGTMNIKGTFSGVGQQYNASIGGATLSGAFYRVNTTNNPSQGARISNGEDAQKDDYFGFEASRNWTGATASAGSHSHTISTQAAHNHSVSVGNAGSGTAMSLVQPSMAVARWKRTA